MQYYPFQEHSTLDFEYISNDVNKQQGNCNGNSSKRNSKMVQQ